MLPLGTPYARCLLCCCGTLHLLADALLAEAEAEEGEVAFQTTASTAPVDGEDDEVGDGNAEDGEVNTAPEPEVR